MFVNRKPGARRRDYVCYDKPKIKSYAFVNIEIRYIFLTAKGK